MIGNGQLYDEITELSKNLEIKNIDFIEWIKYNELVSEINKADVVLGIFGGTEKSLRVIPNKVFQAIAVWSAQKYGRPLRVKLSEIHRCLALSGFRAFRLIFEIRASY